MRFIIAVREGVDVRKESLIEWLHSLSSYQQETYGVRNVDREMK